METQNFAIGQQVEFREKPTDPLQTGTIARVGGATIGVFPAGSAANSITILKTNATILPQDNEPATSADEVTPLLPEERLGEVGAEPESATEAAAPEPTVLKALNLEFNTQVVNFSQLVPNPFNVRKQFTGIHALGESILTNGLEQVFKARHKPGTDLFELFDGNRRQLSIDWLIKINRIAADLQVEIIVEEATDEQMLDKALTTNLFREDFNILELAEGFAKLEEMGRSQGEIGKKYGYSQPAVANIKRLRNLPDEIKKYMVAPTDEEIEAAAIAGTDIDLKPKLSAGHGGVLLQLKNKEDKLLFLERILVAEVSVAQLAREVREFNAEREKLLNPPLAFEPAPSPQLTEISFVEPQTDATLEFLFEGCTYDQKNVLAFIFAKGASTVPAIAAGVDHGEGYVYGLLVQLMDKNILEENPVSETATPDDDDAPEAQDTPSDGASAEPASTDTNPDETPKVNEAATQSPAAPQSTETPKPVETPKATPAPAKTPEPVTSTAAPKPRGAVGTTGKTPEPAQAKAIPPVMFSAVVPGEDKAWVDAKGLKMAPMLTTVRRLYGLIEANESLAKIFELGGIGDVMDFFDTAYPPSPKA
jgi:ParB/RepB/Spo0J family partition protein